MEEVPAPPWLNEHVVAVPYPSRGHINPMFNLCIQIANSSPTTLITIVVTEEWFSYIASDPKPQNVQFATVPNVIPLQSHITSDIPAFFHAAIINLKDPFEELLHRLQPPVTAVIGDVDLQFPIDVARRRNVPVAVLWTMSASFYLMLHQLGSLAANRCLTVDLLDDYEEHIPGISSAQISDLRTVLRENDLKFIHLALECISKVPKANCLILNTIQELESESINSLKSIFPFPIYPISFPYSRIKSNHSSPNASNNIDHLNWLNSQPHMSVLYISLGSFLSVSRSQMNEIVSALNKSGVRFFWVAREEAFWLKEKCGERGLIVPWCDQLKILSHSSIGAFLCHCGWNSTLESLFSGVPILTFPLFFDQVPNSSQILEEWKIGLELRRLGLGIEGLVTQEEILEVIRKFMDYGSEKGKEIRDRALEIKGICDRAVAEGGSSNLNLDAFMNDVLCVTRK